MTSASLRRAAVDGHRAVGEQRHVAVRAVGREDPVDPVQPPDGGVKRPVVACAIGTSKETTVPITGSACRTRASKARLLVKEDAAS